MLRTAAKRVVRAAASSSAAPRAALGKSVARLHAAPVARLAPSVQHLAVRMMSTADAKGAFRCCADCYRPM